MHIVVALNLYGDVVINMILWLFRIVTIVEHLNLFLEVTLGCLEYIFSSLCLG